MAEQKTPEPAPQVAADPNEGPGKGKAFFDRARTVAATNNFDYAIDMYIEGLNREPFNVEEMKALREASFRRKIAGTKSSGGLLGAFGGGLKLPYKGKTPKEAMLNNLFALSRDVGNITAMLAVIRNADLMGHVEVLQWMGPILKEANRTNKKPDIEIYKDLAAIYAKHEEYGKACETMNEAVQMNPNDAELSTLSNQYAANETMKRGKYGPGGSFKESIKDVEKTKELLQEDALAKSEEYLKKMLAQAKADYEANPKEMQVINKYYKALVDMEDEEHENRAIELLKKAYADTQIYRLKSAIGDIKMKQYRRNLKILRDTVKQDPDDKEMLHEYEKLNKERIAYELEEFKERVEHMPTDTAIKYEYGTRLWEAHRFDDAIMALQEAQQNPKHRVDALHLLGRAFLQQGMSPEAVDTCKRSIEEYDLAATGNKISKELHYWYARSLEANRQYKDAIEIYSKVVRWDIAFHDARKRLNELRAKLDPPA